MINDTGSILWTGILLMAVVVAMFSGYPIAICLAAVPLIVATIASLTGTFDMALLWAIPGRIFAILNNDLLIAVPLFIFMGSLLERSRVAERLLTTLAGAFGNVRGGLGFAVLSVGALLAASTGIVGATVVTLGMLALPTLLANGYSARLASGLVAASGTLGQIVPPSIILILLGDQLSSAWQQSQFEAGNFAPDAISVNDLFAAALLPGLLLVGLYAIYLLLATRRGATDVVAAGVPGIKPISFKRLAEDLLAPVVLIIAVLGSILFGVAAPTEAAGLGALGALLIAALTTNGWGHRLIQSTWVALTGLAVIGAFDMVSIHHAPESIYDQMMLAVTLVLSVVALLGIGLAMWRAFELQGTVASPIKNQTSTQSALADSVLQTLTVSCMIFTLVIAASIFALVLRGFGGDSLLQHWLNELPGGAVTLLLTTMLAMFLLGFILDFVEIIYVVIPIVLPVLLSTEISPGVTFSPLWLGVMIALNLQTSFLTPPFGFALFYLRGVAPPSVKLGDIYRGSIPFIALQLLALAIVWWFPALATWLPGVVQ